MHLVSLARPTLTRLLVGGLLSLAALSAAQADGPRVQPSPLPKYQQECAACHLAYPPGMLSATSWQRLMGSLDKHFGTNASLDAASQREISAWLTTHAGTYPREPDGTVPDRITRTRWFLRQHNEREIPPSVWKRPAVGSPSNCTACHTQAERGSFRERDIRIPE